MGYTRGMRNTFLLLAALSAATLAGAETFGRERTMRSATTSLYEAAVSKAGRLDIHLADGSRYIDDAWAGVQLAGDRQPRRFKLDARHSERDDAGSQLGQGKVLSLYDESFVYAIQTFETQPFLTLRVAYINGTKKPQTVEKIVVLAGEAGEESGLMLGAGADGAKLLTSVAGVDGACETVPVTEGSAQGFGQLAAWNQTTGRMLIAGFLGAPRSSGQFHVSMSSDTEDDTGGAFSFEWRLDPPVTLEPGKRLEIPPLYVSVAGEEPAEELRRFGRALELEGGTPPRVECACDGATGDSFWRLAFLPDAWQPQCGANSSIDLDTRRSMRSNAIPGEGIFSSAELPYREAVQNSPAGEWRFVSLPKSTPGQFQVKLPARYYTVYDLVTDRYLGTAIESIDVEVTPESDRHFCLRPYSEEPMLVSAKAQDASPGFITAYRYDAASATMSVSARAQAMVSQQYRILLPEGVTVARIQKSQGEALFRQEGRVVYLSLTPAETGALQWSATFAAGTIETPPTVHLPE